jgi:hypothetical protein
MPLDIWAYLIGPYNVGDTFPYFMAFWLLLTVGAIYVRTQNFQLTYTVLALGALMFQSILPGGLFDTLIFFAITIGITYTGYKLMVKGGSKWG